MTIAKKSFTFHERVERSMASVGIFAAPRPESSNPFAIEILAAEIRKEKLNIAE